LKERKEKRDKDENDIKDLKWDDEGKIKMLLALAIAKGQRKGFNR